MRIKYITGIDSNLFLQIGILLDCFESMMGEKLYVCDFGLSPPQKQFLKSKGILLELSVPAQWQHPWYGKASILHFAEEDIGDALVWIDADMMLLCSIANPIEDLIAQMERQGIDLAICKDAGASDIQSFLLDTQSAGGNVSPFASALAALKIECNLPYLNTGFFICRSKALLLAWKDYSFKMPFHVLIEQNAFNLAAYGGNYKVALLEPTEWNLHGPYLAFVSLQDVPGSEEPRLTPALIPMKILHPTSANEAYHHFTPVKFQAGRHSLSGVLKVFRSQELQNLQLNHISQFFRKNEDRLIAAWDAFPNG